MTDQELISAARTAALHAYCPYSEFRVGAAAVSPEGVLYTGANVENAAYPSSSCAEAVTIQYAMSQGERVLPTVAVACIDATDMDGAYPCGRCRQILTESRTDRVLVTIGSGPFRTHSLSELIPFPFPPDLP